ncbi:MAG TPA: hypothetical protein DCX89_07695 [Saprospirales bacterium]|nr:hypothetical protein [Saprospirales bacterium]HRQ28687.1 PH domain-containing protein [Saprospiraceae bacterium]
MKRNDFDFSQPNKQSYAAIVFLAYHFFRILVRQLWPVLIAVLVGRENLKNMLFWIIAGISVLVFVFAVISYLRYYFYIDNDELVVVKGIFKRSRTNIPFQRIQTINIEQSILHQLLQVAKLEVDTAGSKGTEFSFSALSMAKAEALRQVVLEQKSKILPLPQTSGVEKISGSELALQTILHLSFSELIRIGATQNHLRSLLIILAFFMTLYNQVEDIGVDTDQVVDQINEEVVYFGKIAIIILGLMSVLASFTFSLIRTIIRYYDFTLFRTNDGFKIVSGLFTKKQISAKDHKIQYISWADNPLKRLLGLYDVYLKQASSSEVRDTKSISIPGCNSKNVERIKFYYVSPEEWKDLKNFKISGKYIYVRVLYFGILPAIILGSLMLFTDFKIYSLLTALWPLLVYLAFRVNHKKWNFAINHELIYIRNGIFGNYFKALRLYKIQSMALRQSIYQRKHQLATITIYTASGNINIPYVHLDLAKDICNFVLFKIESDKRKWM